MIHETHKKNMNKKIVRLTILFELWRLAKQSGFTQV